MKLLYVTSADFDRTDAPTVRARGLARALAEAGCSVRVLGINGAPSNGAFTYQPVRYPPARRLGQIVYQCSLAARLAAAGDIQAILLRETPFCIQPFALGLPVHLEVNGLALEELKAASGPRRAVAERLYRWGYSRARTIFALTPAIRDYLVAEADVPAERICVVSNAIDPEQVHPVDRTEARKRLGLPLGRPIVFYVGSYHRQHGLKNVVAAESDALFLMAGDGGEREAEFRRGADPARFRFLGRVDDATLLDAIGAADLCLNPAAEETRALTDASFPHKIAEYLACGRPVLSMGDAPAVRDALEGCGIVVAATAPALAAGLREVFSRPAELEAMGRRARERAVERFSYRTVVKRYLERMA